MAHPSEHLERGPAGRDAEIVSAEVEKPQGARGIAGPAAVVRRRGMTWGKAGWRGEDPGLVSERPQRTLTVCGPERSSRWTQVGSGDARPLLRP